MIFAQNIFRIFIAISTGFAYSMWVAKIANQQNYFILLAVYFLHIALGAHMFFWFAKKSSKFWSIIFGAVTGYISSAASSVFWRCTSHGFNWSSFNINADLYFFPLASLGWLYGGIIFLLILSKDK